MGGQADRKSGADAGGAGYLDDPTVPLDNTKTDGQSQSTAIRLKRVARKGLEDMVHLLLSEAWAVVGNVDLDPCFADPGHWEDPCNTPGDNTRAVLATRLNSSISSGLAARISNPMILLSGYPNYRPISVCLE